MRVHFDAALRQQSVHASQELLLKVLFFYLFVDEVCVVQTLTRILSGGVDDLNQAWFLEAFVLGSKVVRTLLD